MRGIRFICLQRCTFCILLGKVLPFLLPWLLPWSLPLFRCGWFIPNAVWGAPFASSCLDNCLDHCLYSDADDSFRMPLEVRFLHPLALTTALTIAFIQMWVIRSGCRRRCAFCILCLQVKWTKSKLKLGCTRIWSSELKPNKSSEKMESQVTHCTVYSVDTVYILYIYTDIIIIMMW